MSHLTISDSWKLLLTRDSNRQNSWKFSSSPRRASPRRMATSAASTRARNACRASWLGKSERRTDASCEMHSIARAEWGEALLLYACSSVCSVFSSSTSERQLVGTWTVPTSSVLSSLEVPMKSYERQQLHSFNACSRSLTSCSGVIWPYPPARTEESVCMEIWKIGRRLLSRKETDFLRWRERAWPALLVFISVLSSLRIWSPMMQWSTDAERNCPTSFVMSEWSGFSNHPNLVIRASRDTSATITNP
mmetsp:Transcript_30714/g.63537  ORF Transcript_30714/g.63537 Transcript_30714/m.63537 type:complete len:249 (-) Transcript_30714:346-1092(-)